MNQDVHSRIANAPSSKYPPAFDIDLLVDDSRGIELEGQRHGFRTVIIDPDDANWVNTVLTEVNKPGIRR